MPKTKFSKSELIKLHSILRISKMLPCDEIKVWTDPHNYSAKIVYTIIKFVKGKKQLDIGLVTKTCPKNHSLEEQLNEYFLIKKVK